jgi:hypothetical protein
VAGFDLGFDHGTEGSLEKLLDKMRRHLELAIALE